MTDKSFGREPKMHTTEPSADEVKMKKGGRMMLYKAEGGKVKKLEKELKQHEGMKAGKAHHGLKKGGRAAGGMMPAAMRGAIPEAIARRALPIMGRRDTPVMPSAGAMMKHGGKIQHKANGGSIAAPAGYKMGGSVSSGNGHNAMSKGVMPKASGGSTRNSKNCNY